MIPLSEERDAFVTEMRKRRKAMGLSLEQLAEAIGVDSKTVRHWEQGRNSPNLGRVLLWTRMLNCKLGVTGR